MADIPNTLPGGSTAMVRGPLSRLGRAAIRAERPAVGPARHRALHRRRVEQRAGHLPGIGDVARAPDLRTSRNGPGSRQQTHDSPTISGLYDTQSGTAAPSYPDVAYPWNSTTLPPSVPLLPLTSFHSYHRSGGIPTTFPLVSSHDGGRRPTDKPPTDEGPLIGRRLVCGAPSTITELLTSGNDVGMPPLRWYEWKLVNGSNGTLG